jgi:hypothetical protein
MEKPTIYILISEGQKYLTIDGYLELIGYFLAMFRDTNDNIQSQNELLVKTDIIPDCQEGNVDNGK